MITFLLLLGCMAVLLGAMSFGKQPKKEPKRLVKSISLQSTAYPNGNVVKYNWND